MLSVTTVPSLATFAVMRVVPVVAAAGVACEAPLALPPLPQPASVRVRIATPVAAYPVRCLVVACMATPLVDPSGPRGVSARCGATYLYAFERYATRCDAHHLAEEAGPVAPAPA